MTNQPLAPAGEGPEQCLLARLCAAGLTRVSGEPVTVEGIDWQRFLALARNHRVVPVVWRNLAKQPGIAIPLEIMRELRQGHEQNALAAMRATAHLIKIVEALGAAKIPALPLKGVCLAALYFGDIAARHTGDIDILVAPADLARANGVMRELGYLRVSNQTRVVMHEPFDENMYFRLHSMFVSPDGVVVELHFQLHFNPAVLPLDASQIIGLGAKVRLGKASLPVMPTPLQFVFLATHGARHEWERLQWIYDVAVLADRASDEEIRQWLTTAAEHRLTNPAIQALILAERVFGLTLPPEVSRACRNSLRIRYMVRRAEQALLRGPTNIPHEPEPTFKLGRRLYRMCVTSRPAYLWHEFRNGLSALVSRLSKPSAALS